MRKLLYVVLIILLTTACKKDRKLFNGYIDTDLIYLSADFGGRLSHLAVNKGQNVQKNQLLFKLEQTNELKNVQISQFNQKSIQTQLKQALTQLHYYEINLKRITAMHQKNAASQSDLDAAQRDLDISKQQLADIGFKIQSSKIETATKKWQVTRKENFATTKGIVFDTYYSKGEFVQAGFPVLSLISRNNVKAIFFVGEDYLSQIRINEPIRFRTNQNSKLVTGRIYYISNIAEYTPPILYSREERHRLVFRVEAKIDSPDLEELHLGQPVTLELA